MKIISFQEKNNLIVKHKNGEYFSKDLELFKKHCPGHSLNNELAKANKFSYARLDGLMLSYLLNVVSIEDILENRTQEKQSEPQPRTENRISESLASSEEAPLQSVERDNVKKFMQRINESTTIQDVETILQEDKEGGERSTVQNAGLKRIEILKAPQEDPNGKKKDQNMTSSQ